MNLKAVTAIFKRNLAAYFGSPSGYLFICAFVLVSGLSAFWPHEFFNSNLANLDQLNKLLPLIMLGFVPAITMGVWADERRQGTDELLLTLPNGDLEVVLGKYLGAVAIFTISLLFSLTNVVVLMTLGEPDIGLLLSTYAGYWFVGLAMLAIGIVASFLSANLTVAFVLGVAFNAPLVLLSSADVFMAEAEWIRSFKDWSIHANFLDFSRGVLSLSSISFFLGLACIMLYLCSVLIGKRHWSAVQGRAFHYWSRAVATAVVAFSVTFFLRDHDLRGDVSSEGLSSLSDKSLELLEKLDRNVEVEAFVSPELELPETYVQTRLNLLTTLDELQKRSGGKVKVRVHETESFKKEATVAEQRYGIEAQNIFVKERGRNQDYRVYLGLAFKSGVDDKLVVPFLDKGIPVEYELMRSIATLAGQSGRKKIGVFSTEAPIMGINPMSDPMGMGFNMGGGSPPYQFITELRKQYDVQNVAAGVIKKGAYDALVVVQPSTLNDEKLGNLITAIENGVPTVIFEDPLPLLDGRITGTYDPLRNEQSGGPGQPPSPSKKKGDISRLWHLLGVHFNYDPATRAKAIQKEVNEMGARLNELPPGFQSLLTGLGFHAKRSDLERKINALVAKANGSQKINESDWKGVTTAFDAVRDSVNDLNYRHPLRKFVQENLVASVKGRLEMLEKRVVWDDYNPFPKIEKPTEGFPNEFVYVGGSEGVSFADHDSTAGLQHILLTCPGSLHDAKVKNLKFTPLLRVAGKNSGFTNSAEFWNTSFFGQREGFNPNRTTTLERGHHVLAAKITGKIKPKGDSNATNFLDVTLVADSDVLGDPFFNIRNRGAHADFPLDVDNVTFVLNLIDELAKDNRFIEIRARRKRHRTLSAFEDSIAESREKAREAVKEQQDNFRDTLKREQDKMNARLAELQQRKENMDQRQFDRMLRSSVAQLQQVLATKQRQMEQDMEAKIKKADNEMQLAIREQENAAKLKAVFLPPILPLCIAIFVYRRKRRLELEGAEASRVITS
ncbi:MAG: Gldg family protein [Opitutales bacterium]